MNKPKTIVIYHRADFDGIFCREIAKKFMPEAELIGWDYGDPVPEVPLDCHLYILDLSVPELMNHPNLIWIDHHKSAIEKYPATIPGYRIDGVAACRLAWQWFSMHQQWEQIDPNGQYELPGKQMFIDRVVGEPWAVRLAGEYDIWDKRDPNAELFQHGLRSVELTNGTWDQMLGDYDQMNACTTKLLFNGETVQYVKAKENESIITSYGFDVEFEGLKFLACNHARFNSLLFTAGLKPEHDACLGFNWTGKDWRVSLYHAPGKEHWDLSQIAIKHGGGGHKGACGFRMKTLPWLEVASA